MESEDNYKKIKKVKSGAGFTLVELMVTVSISVVIMTTVLFSYSKFNNDLVLTSAIQEVAIAVRQAQMYSLSVKERITGAGDFTSGYGIYFSASSPQSYIIFSDTGPNPDGRWDGGPSVSGIDTVIETGILRNGVTVARVCGAEYGGNITCPPSNNGNYTSANITFMRPKTDAKIRFNDNFYGGVSGLYKTGVIVLVSPQGKFASTTIENTGQISVQ